MGLVLAQMSTIDLMGEICAVFLLDGAPRRETGLVQIENRSFYRDR